MTRDDTPSPIEGMPVADVIRRVSLSEQTFERWKKRYAGIRTVLRNP